MSDPDILDRIDDTLDDYDQWNGHSPDAARWAGGPEESEWPTDMAEAYFFLAGAGLDEAMLAEESP